MMFLGQGVDPVWGGGDAELVQGVEWALSGGLELVLSMSSLVLVLGKDGHGLIASC